jgi:hypothetical protein
MIIMIKKIISFAAMFILSIWILICLTVGGGAIMATYFDISFGWGVTASVAIVLGTFYLIFLD